MIGRLAHRRTTPCSSEDQMEPPRIDDKQPWAACYLTDILLSYVKENHGTGAIDCASLFRAVEGFETPADPALFLSDVNNWVPLAVLRELEFSCERLSGKKDRRVSRRQSLLPARQEAVAFFIRDHPARVERYSPGAGLR
jgi:hypothetical protein